MATKAAPAKAAKPSASREVANWDEELAKQAGQAAQVEASTATGAFFSIKSGVLAWNDAPVKNNRMAAVVSDFVLENVFYGSDYDPDEPKGPLCFAFGRDEKDMAPHQVCVDAGTAVSEKCDGCPNNEWASAEKGRGKACRNIRRLALLPAGNLDDNGKFTAFKDPKQISEAEIGFLKIPVTSTKGFSGYVKSLAASLKRPPHGVFTRISVVPDAKNQFKVTFEGLDSVPNSLMGAVMAKHAESKALIEQPYSVGEEDDKPAKKGKPAAKGVPAKKAPTRRKY